MTTVVVLGAKEVAAQCLSLLHDRADELALSAIYCGVKSEEEPFSRRAKELGYECFSSETDIPSSDYLISIQWSNVLSPAQLSSARRLAVNLHMAPLPEYRGCNQFTHAILNDDKEFGTTIHVMSASVDAGDILFQRRFPIPDQCWVEQLVSLTVQHSVELFRESLDDLFRNGFTRTPQAEIESSRRSFSLRSDIDQLKQLDLSQSREDVERQIRATSMPGFSPPFFMVAGERILVSREEK